MNSSLTFFSLISSLINEANEGLNEALKISANQSVLFITPEIEFQLKCCVSRNTDLLLIPSNGFFSNYYNTSGESKISFKLRLKNR